MNLIEWSDKYLVNIKMLDEQHQKLVEIINLLYSSMREGKGNFALGGILNDLISYSSNHFSTEEKLLDDFNYPEFEFHKEEHRYFIQKITDFKEAFDIGKQGLSVEVLDFLKSWLSKHIVKSDKKFAPYLHEKGIT